MTGALPLNAKKNILFVRQANLFVTLGKPKIRAYGYNQRI